jgi:hypothetical protein
VSNSGTCGTAASASIYSQYARSDVILTETTDGYSFTAFLQGCTNTAATFSTVVYPRTYEDTVSGFVSDLPSPAYVGISAATVSSQTSSRSPRKATAGQSGPRGRARTRQAARRR